MSNTTPAPTQQPGLTFDQVENYWIQAGGNAQAAQMAAAIADASSGLNPGATRTNPDGTQSIGLWLIPQNGTPPGSTDPLANARAAVQLSNNGTDWSQWCVAWSDNNCGINGGTYLGDGANALGSLAGQSGSYNVAGSSPSGTGVGASATTSAATPTTTTTSTGKTILYVAIAIALIAAVFLMTRRKLNRGGEGSGDTENVGASQTAWTPDAEGQIMNSGKTDQRLSEELGRSVRSIQVRRDQIRKRRD